MESAGVSGSTGSSATTFLGGGGLGLLFEPEAELFRQRGGHLELHPVAQGGERALLHEGGHEAIGLDTHLLGQVADDDVALGEDGRGLLLFRRGGCRGRGFGGRRGRGVGIVGLGGEGVFGGGGGRRGGRGLGGGHRGGGCGSGVVDALDFRPQEVLVLLGDVGLHRLHRTAVRLQHLQEFLARGLQFLG